MTPKVLTQSIVIVPIDDIEEHPQNPNRNELHPIVDSIEKVGFYGAITVQKSTGYIIAGNHRYRAAIASGMEEVPVNYLDVDDTEAIRIMLNDNRTAEFSEQDADQVDELMSVWDNVITIDGMMREQNGSGTDEDHDNDEESDEERREKVDRSKDPDAARRIISLTYNAEEYAVASAAIAKLKEESDQETNGAVVLEYLRKIQA